MPALTRRRDHGALQETWLVYWGAARGGNGGVDPGFEPGKRKNGTAASFEATRSTFETAWRVFLSKRIEADFKACAISAIRPRGNMRYGKAGERLPSQRPNSMMRCACGKAFDSHRLEESLIHVPHLSAAHEVHRAEPLH